MWRADDRAFQACSLVTAVFFFKQAAVSNLLSLFYYVIMTVSISVYSYVLCILSSTHLLVLDIWSQHSNQFILEQQGCHSHPQSFVQRIKQEGQRSRCHVGTKAYLTVYTKYVYHRAPFLYYITDGQTVFIKSAMFVRPSPALMSWENLNSTTGELSSSSTCWTHKDTHQPSVTQGCLSSSYWTVICCMACNTQIFSWKGAMLTFQTLLCVHA